MHYEDEGQSNLIKSRRIRLKTIKIEDNKEIHNGFRLKRLETYLFQTV